MRAFLALILAAALPLAAAEDAAPSDLYGEAMVVRWCRPPYPPELVQEKREGVVVVRFVVDDHGEVVRARVGKSFDPRANESALTAVRQWKLSPALAAGKPVASCLDVGVFFRLANLKEKHPPAVPVFGEAPRECKTTEPVPLSNALPDYPAALPPPPHGRVRIDIDLDAAGKPIAIRTQAAERALGEAAAEAARKWTFNPAVQGDLAVPSTYHCVIDFSDSPIPPPEVIRVRLPAVHPPH